MNAPVSVYRPPSIPETDADIRWVASADGIRLRLYRLPGPVQEGPVLLWGHANGFAAGSYLPWLKRMGRLMTVYAFDARGHGGSDVPPEPYSATCGADALARDLSALASAVRAEIGPERPLHFAAHSFTGLAALRLGSVFDEIPWASATLFEPPLSPTPDFPAHAVAAELADVLVNGALRRRPDWDSPQAFVDRLSGSKAFTAWDTEMMQAHGQAILHPKADGDGYTLACPPTVEAAGYRMTMNTSTFRFANRFQCPTTFVASQPAGEGATPSWAALVQGLAAERVPGARLVRLPDTGHMMLFEKPDECLTELLASMEQAKRG